MMRKLFLLGTGAFWIAVLVFWAGARWLPSLPEQAPPPTEKRFTMDEIARHASPEDC